MDKKISKHVSSAWSQVKKTAILTISICAYFYFALVSRSDVDLIFDEFAVALPILSLSIPSTVFFITAPTAIAVLAILSYRLFNLTISLTDHLPNQSHPSRNIVAEESGWNIRSTLFTKGDFARASASYSHKEFAAIATVFSIIVMFILLQLWATAGRAGTVLEISAIITVTIWTAAESTRTIHRLRIQTCFKLAYYFCILCAVIYMFTATCALFFAEPKKQDDPFVESSFINNVLIQLAQLHSISLNAPLRETLRKSPNGKFLPRIKRLRFASARKAVLADVDFSDVNLEGADLAISDLSGSIFTNSKLAGATIAGTNLAGANLSEARGVRMQDLISAEIEASILPIDILASLVVETAEEKSNTLGFATNLAMSQRDEVSGVSLGSQRADSLGLFTVSLSSDWPKIVKPLFAESSLDNFNEILGNPSEEDGGAHLNPCAIFIPDSSQTAVQSARVGAALASIIEIPLTIFHYSSTESPNGLIAYFKSLKLKVDYLSNRRDIRASLDEFERLLVVVFKNSKCDRVILIADGSGVYLLKTMIQNGSFSERSALHRKQFQSVFLLSPDVGQGIGWIKELSKVTADPVIIWTGAFTGSRKAIHSVNSNLVSATWLPFDPDIKLCRFRPLQKVPILSRVFTMRNEGLKHPLVESVQAAFYPSQESERFVAKDNWKSMCERTKETTEQRGHPSPEKGTTWTPIS